MYGLKHTRRDWYEKMDPYLLSQGFIHCKFDSKVYMMINDDSLLIIVLYIDDLLIIGSSVLTIATMKTSLHDRFSMIDVGHYILGILIS